MKVLITKQIPKLAEDLLTKAGYEVKVFKKRKNITQTELVKYGKDADAILSTLAEKMDSNVIDKLSNCKIIANYAVGYNNIDIKHANQKGIVVTNTPDVLTDATAEIAVALTLACSRRIVESQKFVEAKKFKGWEPELLLGIQLTGKIVGIIGAGRIGQATARRLKSFGTKIIYYSKSKKIDFEKELDAKKVSLDKLMKTSDVISVHLPLNEKSKLLINKSKLKLMKKSAIFINTARGEVVDEKELIKMLKNKSIFSAGFDVYENEPYLNKELFKLKNVVLLPHIGSATVETRDKMAELAVNNIINVLNNKKPLTEVKS